MKISARTLEQQLANESEHGVAKILMQWRHRVGLDPAAKAISHHQVIAGAQLFDKRHQVYKVIRVVGITHDDVTTASRANPTQERAAIAFGGHIDHARAAFRGQAL